MGFWFWFWIWVGIVIFSIGVYTYIGLSLFRRSKKLIAPASRLQSMIRDFQVAQQFEATTESVKSALDTTAEEIFKRRAKLNRDKLNRKEERTRSLVKRIKDIDFDESRLS